MSVEGDLFRVTVKGSRESIVKMMNAALKSFNADNIIKESDDVETMNAKLEMFTGQGGKAIGIPDLLGQGNDAAYRYLELVRIEDDSPGLIAKFSYYIDEAASYVEDEDDGVTVSDWDDIALQNNCIVFLDDDWYSNGRFIRFGAATIYDPLDGDIRRIYLESGSIYDAEDYPFFLKTLAHLYPDHYGADWDSFHSNHPDVEISEEECLAWFNEQKQPWQQDQSEDPKPEEEDPGSLFPIDENGHAIIPEGTTSIDDFAFLQCDKLVSVSIPDTVQVIGEGAFCGCVNLTSITLPSSLKLINEKAFFCCEKLTDVSFPGSLQRIEALAFAECISLENIDIPSGVTIDPDAFEGSPCEVGAGGFAR